MLPREPGARNHRRAGTGRARACQSSTRSSGTRSWSRRPTSSPPTSASRAASSRRSAGTWAPRAARSTPPAATCCRAASTPTAISISRCADAVTLADDFLSGPISAAHGGTTTVMPFACQLQGQSVRAAVEDYHRRAAGKPVIDYAFHLIVSDPTEDVLRRELPALIARGLHVVQDLHDLRDPEARRPADHRRAGRRAPRGRHGDGARGELRLHRLAHRAARARGPDGAVLPRGVAAARRRARGHAPGHHHVRARRRAHPARARLRGGRRGADPLGAGAGLADLRRDVPAVPRADGRSPRRAGVRGRQVRLQPAAARRGEPGGDLARAPERRLPRLLLRPRRVPLRSSGGQEAARHRGAVHEDPQRRARRRDAAAHPLLRGRQQGPHRPRRPSSPSPPPTPPSSTGSTRARAASPWAPTPTSSSGTRTARS